MRFLLVSLHIALTAALAISCSDPVGKGMVTGTVTPSNAISATIAPNAIALDGFSTLNCPVGLFSPRFDLLISASSRAFVDRVTLRLGDGGSVGGPSVTFARADLDRLFGSTIVAGTARFAFQPQFECLLSRPSGLVVDVILVDVNGNPQQVTATAIVNPPTKAPGK